MSPGSTHTEGEPGIQGRIFQAVFIVSTLAISWLGMMVIHEFGHVLFAWASGGAVARVVLGPLEFSRTELERNPHPLFVAWGGALAGTAIPLATSTSLRFLRLPAWQLLQFFSGFCLVANAVYFGVVSFIPNSADPGEMMRMGCPQWPLVLFGVVAFPLGLFLWNGLGGYFGLGGRRGKVNRKVAASTFLCLLALIGIEILTYAG